MYLIHISFVRRNDTFKEYLIQDSFIILSYITIPHIINEKRDMDSNRENNIWFMGKTLEYNEV